MNMYLIYLFIIIMYYNYYSNLSCGSNVVDEMVEGSLFSSK